MKLRIGTRGSELALWQARHIAALLARDGVESELVVLKTRGDVIDDVPLTQVEGKAFFTAEIERALLAREVDLAVHSHKDLPSEATPGLTIAAVPARGAQHERLLIASHAHDAEAAFLPLRIGARVGTSAPRRTAQLTTLRPDLQMLDLRGNVPTRVQRLREGRYDAILLAAAGLDRLALAVDGLVAVDLPLALCVPAPAQGALAVQAREADRDLVALCQRLLHDAATEQSIAAERSLLSVAGGGCNLPLGAAVSAAVSAAADRRRDPSPPPQFGGTNGAPAGSTESATLVAAHTFLGAGHPPHATHARFANATGDTPRAAIEAAFAQLATGAATHTGPLAPLTVALTGSASDGSQLAGRLAALGARVVLERVIELELATTPTTSVAQLTARLATRLASLRTGDVLVVTSRQTARHLAGNALPRGVTVAAVGPASARALAEIGFKADIVGHAGARELASQLTLGNGARVFFPCAADATDELERALEPRGIAVERFELYRTLARTGVALADDVSARVYMSPSAVAAALAWERTHPNATAQRFALGHTTADALERAQLTADRPRCSASGVIDELIRQLARLRANPSHFA